MDVHGGKKLIPHAQILQTQSCKSSMIIDPQEGQLQTKTRTTADAVV